MRARARTRSSCAVDRAVGPVWGDHDRLEQVFVNLLENTIAPRRRRAGASGSRWSGGSPTEVAIRVHDHGPGIPRRPREAVFEAVVSGSSVCVRAQGLGLAIARGIVEAHGGEIVVEPPPSAPRCW